MHDMAKLVDNYVALRDRRLSIERQAELVKEAEVEAKATLLANLQESKAGGVAGTSYRVTLRTKTVPTVTNWPELYAYIAANDAFDLLQRRLSPPAVVERWDDKVTIPGVGPIEVTDMSLNKL